MNTRHQDTTITPLPISITRSTALRFLHDHARMIELNPLVIYHAPCQPPSHAPIEEIIHCVWYEITDSISYLPGVPRTHVTYKAAFYNRPDGLQTHVYAPGGVDIRGHWRVGGNLPGEPREPQELGVRTPVDRLYIREDVDVRCSLLPLPFVKKNLKKSHAALIDGLIASCNKREDRSWMMEQAWAEDTSRPPPYQYHQSYDAFRSQHEQTAVREPPSAMPRPESSMDTHAPPVPPKSTARVKSWQPSEEACAEGFYGPGCPHYFVATYGSIDWSPLEMMTPLDQRTSTPSSPEVEARLSSASSSSYSPVAAHPCFCEGSIHASDCPFSIPCLTFSPSDSIQASPVLVPPPLTSSLLYRPDNHRVWSCPPLSPGFLDDLKPLPLNVKRTLSSDDMPRSRSGIQLRLVIPA